MYGLVVAGDGLARVAFIDSSGADKKARKFARLIYPRIPRLLGRAFVPRSGDYFKSPTSDRHGDH
jgi:hypothetical protein